MHIPLKGWKRWMIILTIPLVIVVVALLVFQDSLIYLPRRYSDAAIAQAATRCTQLEYQTDQGQQTAFYYAPKAGGEAQRIWLLFGGNASVALDWQDFVETYPDQRAAFMLVDYPGYGRCAGAPSPSRIQAGSDAAFAALAAKLGQPAVELEKRTAVLGHSLGAAAACQFAAHHAVTRVVLVSPFTELRAMARRSVGWPLCWLLRGNFDNRERLAEITARTPAPPITILHGDNDEVIPVAMGRTLAAELGDRCSYQEISGADHNGILEMAESQIWAAMQPEAR